MLESLLHFIFMIATYIYVRVFQAYICFAPLLWQENGLPGTLETLEVQRTRFLQSPPPSSGEYLQENNHGMEMIEMERLNKSNL